MWTYMYLCVVIIGKCHKKLQGKPRLFSHQRALTHHLETTAKSNRARTHLPIFAKQSHSGSTDWNGSAGPINVPHCESNLGTLGKVGVLDWQPQPLVPAAPENRINRENKMHM